MAKIVKVGGVGKNPNLEKLTRIPPAVFSQRVVSEMRKEAFLPKSEDYYFPCNISFKQEFFGTIDKIKRQIENHSQNSLTMPRKSAAQLKVWKNLIEAKGLKILQENRHE